MTPRSLLPLIGFAVPTLVLGYGFVLPAHGFSGVNELSVGFGGTVLGACVTYVAGIRRSCRRCESAPPE